MDKRPPAPVRYLVLLAALICLVCAVCARSSQPAPATPQPQAQPEPQRQDPQANPAETAPDAGVIANPPAEPPPKYFPATKAPGFLFR